MVGSSNLSGRAKNRKAPYRGLSVFAALESSNYAARRAAFAPRRAPARRQAPRVASAHLSGRPTAHSEHPACRDELAGFNGARTFAGQESGSVEFLSDSMAAIGRTASVANRSDERPVCAWRRPFIAAPRWTALSRCLGSPIDTKLR